MKFASSLLRVIAFAFIVLFISYPLPSSSALPGDDTCDAIMIKGGYLCTFEASGGDYLLTLSAKVQMGGYFVPYTDEPFNPLAPPFLFEVECLSTCTSAESIEPADTFIEFIEPDILECGCDSQGIIEPLYNSSESFTCIGNPFFLDLLSFSGKQTFDGNLILDANFTAKHGYDFLNLKGYCKPVANPEDCGCSSH